MNASKWEDTLKAWVKPASETEEAKRDRTEKAIRECLRDAGFSASVLRVFAKGSYANSTNVRADSDVDVAAEYTSMIFNEQMHGVEGVSDAEIGLSPSDDGYSGNTKGFKDDIEAALKKTFGSSSVTRHDKAITVHAKSSSIDADVVPCFEYRRYHARGAGGRFLFHQGTMLFPDSGGRLINWPQQQHENGVAKNKATGGRYKDMVRVLKRMENKLVEEGLIGELASYFLECLAYNVGNDAFGRSTYVADLQAVLAQIYNATLNDGKADEFVQVNELMWLFHGTRAWSVADAQKFADVAWDYVGFT